MPRIYTSQSDPMDFCQACFPDESEAQEMYGNLGDGPDSRGNCFAYDADHPPYDDGDYYYCELCGRILVDSGSHWIAEDDLDSAAVG